MTNEMILCMYAIVPYLLSPFYCMLAVSMRLLMPTPIGHAYILCLPNFQQEALERNWPVNVVHLV